MHNQRLPNDRLRTDEELKKTPSFATIEPAPTNELSLPLCE